MSDAGEGLIDADARIQERMEELERDRQQTKKKDTRDPEKVRALNRLARKAQPRQPRHPRLLPKAALRHCLNWHPHRRMSLRFHRAPRPRVSPLSVSDRANLRAPNQPRHRLRERVPRNLGLLLLHPPQASPQRKDGPCNWVVFRAPPAHSGCRMSFGLTDSTLSSCQ